MTHDPTSLPQGLPIPVDDGAALHLRWRALPACVLSSTSGGIVNLAELDHAVVFLYPRTGIPGQPPSLGFSSEEWDSIPGARGCTPQSCSFRDLHADFAALSVKVWGLSTNSTAHQREFKSRMQVPFDFLSDSQLVLTRGLTLPTFEFPVESGGPTTLMRRMAWYVTRAAPHCLPRIQKCWYPVYSPDQNAVQVLTWLRRQRHLRILPIDHGNPVHQTFIEGSLEHHWHGSEIYSRRLRFDAAHLDGFLAFAGETPVGSITLAQHDDQLEVITLTAGVFPGAGSRLLHEAIAEADRRGCRRVFLTTTNDNLHAVEFYQRQGLELVALHARAVDAARVSRPGLPRVAPNGLPIRDEWEFELRL